MTAMLYARVDMTGCCGVRVARMPVAYDGLVSRTGDLASSGLGARSVKRGRSLGGKSTMKTTPIPGFCMETEVEAGRGA
jgi:hypothetical protein